MNDRLRVVDVDLGSELIGGRYIPPHDKEHPFQKQEGVRGLLQKMGLTPSPENHVIYLNPNTRHNRINIILDLKYARHYKKITQTAVKKLEQLKRREFIPPRRGILIHEKTHMQQELRAQAASTLHDGWLIWNYLNKKNDPVCEQLYASLVFLRVLMESESIVKEMESCKSKDYCVVRLSALLNHLAGDRHKSGLYELLERIKTREKLDHLDPYIAGQILSLLGNNDDLFIQMLRGNYDLSPGSHWLAHFEKIILQILLHSLNTPEVYLHRLKQSEALLINTRNNIDSLSSQIKKQLASLLQEKFIPNTVRQQLILSKNHPQPVT